MACAERFNITLDEAYTEFFKPKKIQGKNSPSGFLEENRPVDETDIPWELSESNRPM